VSDSGVAGEPTGDPGLSVAAVARRLGVAPATLRTWDRRYGIGPGEHRPGAHRRYGANDVARLQYMRNLIIAGFPAAEAARAARDRVLDSASGTSPPEPAPAVSVPASGTSGSARSGGGHIVALPGGGPEVRGLARAAQSLDPRACVAILSEAVKRRGVVFAWDHLMVPVLTGIGRQWGSTGRGVEIEHAFSAAVIDALSASVRSAGPATNHRTVLLACAPGEWHALVLWSIEAALAERGIASRNLGASLPAASLAAAVDRLGPAVVFIWSQTPDSADPAVLAAIPVVRPATTILVGGPGWLSDPPPGVERAVDLSDTVARITHALGG
jgi:MerR family transcriptional regulator, light-induced transcriptional regulator